jgi:hypothetical protein
VDTIVELRRADPANRDNRQRVLTGHGRHRDTIGELVVELAEDGHGYATRGTKAEAGAHGVRDVLLAMLPEEAGEGMTWESILEAWPSRPAPRTKTLCDILRDGTGSLWKRSGTGRKGCPFLYWGPIRPVRSDSFPVSAPRGGNAGNESEQKTEVPNGPRGYSDIIRFPTRETNFERETNLGDAYEAERARREAEDREATESIVLLALNLGPLTAVEVAQKCVLDLALAESVLARLVADGQVAVEETAEGVRYRLV